MGGAERNARKKKQQQQAAKSVAAARGSSGGDRKKILIGVAVVAALAAALIAGVVLNQPSTPEALTPAADLKSLTVPVQRQDDATVLVGKDTAKVTVDVYEDFLCPICGTFEEKYGTQLRDHVEAGDLKIRYHVLPLLVRLSDPEGYSRDSANAAVCAADAGKFPEFHDTLYAKQPEEGSAGYTKAQLAQLGTDLGITGDTFKSCVETGTYDQALDADLDKADATPHLQAERSDGSKGFRGTPAVAVGDQLISLDNENWISDLLKA
ncbi:thioredoxin domain-containing protein [Umezawaea sp. Da 62-37]|uniref:DsbA family protein n=1 Tax=Umezawaea sp. Da 62-37 TaxID=3075927 RepID=UPI0028F72A2A|nr:thioredoxin domain-containing protein [Umezawaea sp. Da 62-37]WNV82599.1 thioredoxin domain-containing protein [Umezawaea sp. Da 62-37]